MSNKNIINQSGFCMKNLLTVLLISALNLMLFSLPAQGQNLKLPPYLQNPAPDAITIMWQTNDLSYSWVEYGTDTGNLNVARSVENGIVTANVTKHKVRINDLSPDTKYYYRICTQKVLEYKAYSKELGEVERTDFYSFTTLGSVPENFTCLIFTDLHSKLDIFDKLMNQIAAHDIEFDFTIFNGDIFNDPTSEGEILNLVRHYNSKVDASGKNTFYLRGNHEIRGPYALQWPSFFDFDNNRTYSAFTYGDTRFVLLDNGEDKNDGSNEYFGLVDFDSFRNEQTDWLIKEVASNEFKNAFRKILVHHIPIYSWNNSFDPGFIPCFDLWDPIFKSTPFDVNITGHLHNFKYHSANTVNNPFPLFVGGGNNETSARVMVLIKKEDALTLKSIDCEGRMHVFPIYTEDASLKSVSVQGGTLSPAFNPDRTEYKVLVPAYLSTLSIVGQPLNEASTVKGNITNKPCQIGEKIVMTVVASDGTEKKYTFEVTLSTSSSANYNNSSEKIKVYPNILESNSTLFLELDQHYNDVKLRIYSTSGAEVYADQVHGKNISVPLSLAKGTYILNLTAGQEKFTEKLIVK